MTKLKVLDCTLRDGGYYNQWDFTADIVSKYLNGLHAARIDAIEIGYRNLPKEGFLGPFAYCTDEFLETLNLPSDLIVAVMINAKDILSHPGGCEAALDYLFKYAAHSPVQMVRVAVLPEMFTQALPVFKKLKTLGYQTSANLMQISSLADELLVQILQAAEESRAVDVLYFADSLGNLNPEQVERLVNLTKVHWKGALGMHTHDNLGKALDNSLKAIDCGADWIDSTVLGMGRGAGNVCTELLLLELKRKKIGCYYPDAVFPLVMEDFKILKKRFEWGSNLLYYLSASLGIHPTYIQEMLNAPRYQTEQILEALESLKKSGAASFKGGQLRKAIHDGHSPSEGSWSARGWAKDRDLLVIGSGPKLANYSKDLQRFIELTRPIVISLNINPYIPADHIDAYAVCHKARLLMEADQYEFLGKPVIIPMQTVPENLKQKFSKIKIYDYGMSTVESSFESEEKKCVIPAMLVAAYVLALGIAAAPNRILLAGFDGYGAQDLRQLEMESILEHYKKIPNAPNLVAITPTTYAVSQNSLYSPLLMGRSIIHTEGEK